MSLCFSGIWKGKFPGGAWDGVRIKEISILIGAWHRQGLWGDPSCCFKLLLTQLSPGQGARREVGAGEDD